MEKSPSSRKVLTYQASLALLAALVSTFVLWTPHPFDKLMLGLAVALMLIGTLIKPVISFTITAAVVVLLAATYVWQVLFATHIVLPPAIQVIAWLTLLLLTGYVPAALRRSISGVLKAEQVMRDSFNRLASTDPETEFDSGWRFPAAIEAAFRKYQRYEEPFTLVLIKIMYLDQFRRLYGENETQHLISSVAETCRLHCRGCDQKFRVDQDTFALLLPNTTETGAAQLMSRVEQLLGFHDLVTENKRVTLTVFFGYASSEQGFPSAQELIAHAEDELMFYVP